MTIVCDCTSASAEEPYASFEVLREKCTALRNVFIPQEHWDAYKDFCLSNSDEAHHKPIMWLAYHRDYLYTFTGPIHEFILEGKPETNTVTNQYNQDLVEQWFLKGDFLKRYKACRIFEGRLAELRFASWLRKSGWQISSLEAYGGRFDVEALSPDGVQTVFEVKYLATEENRFRLDVDALNNHNGVSSGWLSLYSPLDYLLCRTYEAAKQLDTATTLRIAILILKDYSAFELQLNDH